MTDHRPVALVTGGGRGVGAEVVRALAARGHAVAIHCHASLREARALAEELAAAGTPALAVTANLREEGAVRALVHRVADHFGRIDVVAACARVRQPGRFEELTAADLAGHYEVNVIGTFVVAQEAAAVMLRQEAGGVIVALGDGGEPRPDELASATSQAAIPALMRSLDAECRPRHPRVRAACVTIPSPPPPPATLASMLLARIDELRSD
jgi:NAD(P)-dependent dehydrogenase (short-subunit alcohol dehydrogenase family)